MQQPFLLYTKILTRYARWLHSYYQAGGRLACQGGRNEQFSTEVDDFRCRGHLQLGCFHSGRPDGVEGVAPIPGGKGDIRDEMVQLIAREVAAANVGLEIQVFPGSSLYKPNDQWNAVTRGLLDMTSFPLDYASGRHPEFSATLMPGLVGNFDRAMRLNDSEFMGDIKKVIENAGALVIADAWLSGAFASKKNCITSPTRSRDR